MEYNKKKFKKYILISFIAAWIIQIAASILALRGNQMAFTYLMALCMLMPLIAVLLSGCPLKGMGWKPKLKGKMKYLFISWFLPAVLTAIGAALFFIVFPKAFDLSGEALAAVTGEDAMDVLRSQGITFPMYLAISAISAIIYAPLINMFFAIGEEAGWRGVMYPMLKDKFGTNKGRIIGGIIWGVWHWPCIAIAGYEYDITMKENPGLCILGMLLFCVFTVCAGILLDYLYEKSQCIWIPSIAHGAINAAATIPIYMTALGYSQMLLLGPAPMGVLSGIPLIIVSMVICLKKK